MDDPTLTTGRVARFRADPHPLLRPFVVEYWGFARDLAAMGGFTITPDCHGELICCVDEMFVVEAGRRERLPRCFLVGLLDGPLRVEAAGVVRCLSARLRPWSVGKLLAKGQDRPSRGWEDAERVLGSRLACISALVERCDWQGAAEELDELLMGEFQGWNPVIDVAKPFLDDGPRPTTLVAREWNITSRQVERRVRLLTRMSPKRLACLARFQKVRDAIWANPSIDLARLAVDAGFSDQPHMTRQFRRYSGQSPAQFARSSVAKKNRDDGEDVAFVQE